MTDAKPTRPFPYDVEALLAPSLARLRRQAEAYDAFERERGPRPAPTRRERLGWRLTAVRHRVALWIAPWLEPEGW